MWITPIDLDALNRVLKHTLCDHLDIRFTEVRDNALVAIMPIGQKHMQPMGIMHGGASCVLAETVGSVAASFCVDQKVKGCVGLDININHLRPTKSGILTATATPFHLGKTTQVWEIQIRNEQHKLVAISRLTVALIDLPKIEGC